MCISEIRAMHDRNSPEVHRIEKCDTRMIDDEIRLESLRILSDLPCVLKITYHGKSECREGNNGNAVVNFSFLSCAIQGDQYTVSSLRKPLCELYDDFFRPTEMGIWIASCYDKDFHISS